MVAVTPLTGAAGTVSENNAFTKASARPRRRPTRSRFLRRSERDDEGRYRES